MACVGFRCKQFGKIRFDSCIEKCTDRCMSRRSANIFKEVSQKPLDGKTITQLLMPTRLMLLMMSNEYFEKPQSFIDRCIGVLGHAHQAQPLPDSLHEERLPYSDSDITGAFDSYEKEDVYDLKIVGAYVIKITLQTQRIKLPWVIQLNFYRILLQQAGFTVNNMYIEPWVKDSPGMAKRMGITKETRLWKVPHISDHWIKKYVDIKKDRLKVAQEKEWAPRCTYKERWGGVRCRSYCPISDLCKRMKK